MILLLEQRQMTNDELCKTIMNFLEYCDLFAIDKDRVNINWTKKEDQEFINEWVNEIWSKEK